MRRKTILSILVVLLMSCGNIKHRDDESQTFLPEVSVPDSPPPPSTLNSTISIEGRSVTVHKTTMREIDLCFDLVYMSENNDDEENQAGTFKLSCYEMRGDLTLETLFVFENNIVVAVYVGTFCLDESRTSISCNNKIKDFVQDNIVFDQDSLLFACLEKFTPNEEGFRFCIGEEKYCQYYR